MVALAARHAIPTMHEWPEFVESGGLICYSTVREETSRLWGVYVGRVLNGAKPADLPVMRATKFELVINGRAAAALGLKIPQALLLRADRVIE